MFTIKNKKTEPGAMKFRQQCNFYIQEMLELYLKGKYDRLSERFIEKLTDFEQNTLLKMSWSAQFFINSFVETFLYLFVKPDYILNNKYFEQLIKLNPVISNIVAMSEYRNTDAQLSLLPNYKKDWIKILILYSSRNTIKLDYKLLFDADNYFFSLWYTTYFLVGSFPSLLMNENVICHLNKVNELNFSGHNRTDAYYISTYYSHDNGQIVKQKINDWIKDSFKDIEIINKPDKIKIAILSAHWKKDNVIYNTVYKYIEALKDDYDLTLIHLGPPKNDLDLSIFKDFKNIELKKNSLDLTPILNNNYALAYYSDIGLNSESVYLSNLRIAPVQITNYGHPVSTGGSCIDYFIGGSEVELLSSSYNNYSERLVLIPGIGAYSFYPSYSKTNLSNPNKEFIVACSWSSYKFNSKMLNNLAKVVQRSSKKVLFRFFPAIEMTKRNNFLPFENELKMLIGQNCVEVIPHKKHEEYARLIQESDIVIDSYPFGGYNSLVDALYLSKPAVTYEGEKAFNRYPSALLKRLGLHELIATNDEEYVDKILHLIENDSYRANVKNKMQNTNLKGTIFDTDEAKYFKKAIDYLILNHDKLKNENSKIPVVID